MELPTYVYQVMEQLHWALARHEVPNVEFVVGVEAESPISLEIQLLQQFPINRLQDLELVLRRPAKTRLHSMDPPSVFALRSVQNLASLAVSDEDLQIASLHHAIVDKSISDRVSAFHMGTNKVAAFLDVVLPSKPSFRADLSVL